MIEDTQTPSSQTGTQTGQPAPSTQSPQDSAPQNELQHSGDQQLLENTQNTIRLPGGGEPQQVVQSTERLSADTTSPLAAFDIGTGLLVATFVFATTMIMLLAWVAKRHTAAVATGPTNAGRLAEAPETDKEIEELQPSKSTPVRKKQKKLSRRQRKKQKNSR